MTSWADRDDDEADEWPRESGSDDELAPLEEAWDGTPAPGWPMTWRGLLPRERWLWFEQLWSDVCALRGRYRLAVRSGWWADEVQLEVLAAFAAWVQRYDAGEWDDPPGKLSLLFDLERVKAALRDGIDPFHPERDRNAFVRHLFDLGCEPPPSRVP